jgi:transposase
MKKLSAETQLSVISLLQQGLSCRQIASNLQIGHSTVSEICSKFPHPLTKSSGGRPTKLSPHDQHHLACSITSGQVDNASQAKSHLSLNVSTQTIRNALKKENLKAAVKAKKPLLLPQHIKARYDFAVKYQHWTEEDWFRVVFSDETKINCLGSDGRVWVWKKPGTGLTQQHVSGTVKFGGGSLMVWGCMTAHGVGYMCRIDGRMDGELYRDILDDYLFQTVDLYGMDRERFVFQQDNDPKHTCRIAKNWFQEHEVEVLDWPAQSPDLNPIEHLWWHLKRRLGAYPDEPKSILELWERVEMEWEKIPKETCIELIKSMPRRVSAVLKAKGGYTKY